MLSVTLGNRLISRRKFATSIICFLLLSTTACSQGQKASSNANAATQTPVLRVGYAGLTSAPIGPFGWAKQKGILEREGLKEIRLAKFANGPDLNEALVAGQLDIGIYGDTPAIVLRARGIKTRLIRVNQYNVNAWLITKKNGGSSLAELKGQKVATQKGSYMHRYLLGLLEQTGIAKDIKVVHLSTREAEAALERGDIAAYAAPSELGVYLKSKGYPAIDEALKHPGLAGTSVIVATEEFLDKQPEFTQKLNQILAESVKDIQNNPQNYYEFHSKITGYPLDIVKASYPPNQWSELAFPPEALQLLEGTKKFLITQSLAKSDFQLNDWKVE
ncbi:MAG TPA: ABC transporter substrate-binding protein [Nostocaceae cyanobacterium]|nr:ABC transporter substrate-binding protein [Nostocaceae cyanobacterium]